MKKDDQNTEVVIKEWDTTQTQTCPTFCPFLVCQNGSEDTDVFKCLRYNTDLRRSSFDRDKALRSSDCKLIKVDVTFKFNKDS